MKSNGKRHGAWFVHYKPIPAQELKHTQARILSRQSKGEKLRRMEALRAELRALNIPGRSMDLAMGFRVGFINGFISMAPPRSLSDEKEAKVRAWLAAGAVPATYARKKRKA